MKDVAEREEFLVPIRIDAEANGYRVKDTFTWNMNGAEHCLLPFCWVIDMLLTDRQLLPLSSRSACQSCCVCRNSLRGPSNSGECRPCFDHCASDYRASRRSSRACSCWSHGTGTAGSRERRGRASGKRINFPVRTVDRQCRRAAHTGAVEHRGQPNPFARSNRVGHLVLAQQSGSFRRGADAGGES